MSEPLDKKQRLSARLRTLVGRKPPPKKNRIVRRDEPPAPPVSAAERARRLGRTVWRYATTAAIAAALVVGGHFAWRFATTSSHFAIRSVRYGALHNVRAGELARRLPISVGDNLFLVDRHAAERALMQHPFVAQAHVRRELPDTLVVEIEEREPAAAVALGALYLCDRDGLVFARATLLQADGLLVVTGLDRDQYIDDPAGSQALLREALAVAAAWQQGGRPPLSEAAVHPSFGITLFLRDGGVEVRLGRGDLARKLGHFDTLARLLASRKEKPRAIYLDSQTRPDRATVRLQPAAEGG